MVEAMVEAVARADGGTRSRSVCPPRSSRSSRSSRKRVLIACLLTMIGLDRLAASAMPTRVALREGALPLIASKARWLAAQPPADVLILGDSTAHHGLDADALSEGGAGYVLNGAIQGGTVLVTRSLAASASWRPRVAVFAFITTAVLDRDDDASNVSDVEFATVRERFALVSPSEALFTSASAIYRRRALLVAIAAWLRSRQPLARTGDGDRQFIVGSYAWGHSTDRRDASRDDADALRIETHVFTEDARGSLAVDLPSRRSDDLARDARQRGVAKEFHPDGGLRADVLRATIRALRADGVEVVLIEMPLASAARALAVDALDRGHRIFATLAEEAHARLFDCRASLADDAFYDSEHLRASVDRSRFSHAIGRAIRDGATSCPALAHTR